MADDTLALDFNPDDLRTGYRLHAVEITNWGTFHEGPHRFEPAGGTAIVTGLNGAGKSTLADVMLTLLVESRGRHYNIAGSAVRADGKVDRSERGEKSYIEGHYAEDIDETTRRPRPKAHRAGPGHHPSVLLAVFHNQDLKSWVSLAQLLWVSGNGEVSHLYIVEPRALDTERDLMFDETTNVIPNRLRDREIKFFKKFEEYRQEFFRKLYLPAERRPTAMFNQAICIKDIPSLTDFIRRHLLEGGDLFEKYQKLDRDFADLRATHRRIETDTRRLAALEVMEQTHAVIAGALARRTDAMADRNHLPFAVARAKSRLADELLERESAKLGADTEKLTHWRDTAERLEAEVESLQREQSASAAGQRLSTLKTELTRETAERDRRLAAWKRFEAGLQAWEPAGPLPDANAHSALIARIPGRIRELTSDRDAADAEKESAIVALSHLQRSLDESRAELADKRARQGNIPGPLDRLRRELGSHLGLRAEPLHFVGELVSVRPDAQRHEAILNRLLRDFALTLIVPAAHRAACDTWATAGPLGVDFAYTALPSDGPAVPAGSPVGALLEPHPDFPEAAERVIAAIAARYPHVLAELPPVHGPAITRAGLIVDADDRRAKPDAISLGSGANIVIGRDNSLRIAELQRLIAESERELVTTQAAKKQAEAGIAQLNKRINAGDNLLQNFSDYALIDHRACSLRIEELEEERRRIQSADTGLRDLEARIAATKTKRKEAAETATRIADALEKLRDTIGRITTRRTEAERLLATLDLAGAEYEPARLDRLAVALVAYDIDTQENRIRELTATITDRMKDAHAEIERDGERIKGLFRAFVADAHNVEVATQVVGSWDLPGYNEELWSPFALLLQKIRNDDLPKNREAFRTKMRNDILSGFNGFSDDLRTESAKIPKAIRAINERLMELPFDAANRTGILLREKRSPDDRILDFRRRLEDTLSHSWQFVTPEAEDAELETRYQKVETLLAKLNGEPEWARHVTDVRQQFEFEAGEYRLDDPTRTVFRTHQGARGKSGGEKNRLATTVLAAGIAHQYGLTTGTRREESFRLVVVDEMFSKTDDEFSRYLLELFKKFHLQLIIIHPPDSKLHVVKPYVESYHIVTKCDDHSRVASMSVSRFEELSRETAVSPV